MFMFDTNKSKYPAIEKKLYMKAPKDVSFNSIQFAMLTVISLGVLVGCKSTGSGAGVKSQDPPGQNPSALDVPDGIRWQAPQELMIYEFSGKSEVKPEKSCDLVIWADKAKVGDIYYTGPYRENNYLYEYSKIPLVTNYGGLVIGTEAEDHLFRDGITIKASDRSATFKFFGKSLDKLDKFEYSGEIYFYSTQLGCTNLKLIKKTPWQPVSGLNRWLLSNSGTIPGKSYPVCNLRIVRTQGSKDLYALDFYMAPPEAGQPFIVSLHNVAFNAEGKMSPQPSRSKDQSNFPGYDTLLSKSEDLTGPDGKRYNISYTVNALADGDLYKTASVQRVIKTTLPDGKTKTEQTRLDCGPLKDEKIKPDYFVF